MTRRTVCYEIEYCNHKCRHFFHCFEDHENIWCDKLNKKIFDFDDQLTDIFHDLKPRPIPEECPLPETK
jgi:hypothetical protein